jgi:hypothetical protein
MIDSPSQSASESSSPGSSVSGRSSGGGCRSLTHRTSQRSGQEAARVPALARLRRTSETSVDDHGLDWHLAPDTIRRRHAHAALIDPAGATALPVEADGRRPAITTGRASQLGRCTPSLARKPRLLRMPPGALPAATTCALAFARNEASAGHYDTLGTDEKEASCRAASRDCSRVKCRSRDARGAQRPLRIPTASPSLRQSMRPNRSSPRGRA